MKISAVVDSSRPPMVICCYTMTPPTRGAERRCHQILSPSAAQRDRGGSPIPAHYLGHLLNRAVRLPHEPSPQERTQRSTRLRGRILWKSMVKHARFTRVARVYRALHRGVLLRYRYYWLRPARLGRAPRTSVPLPRPLDSGIDLGAELSPSNPAEYCSGAQRVPRATRPLAVPAVHRSVRARRSSRGGTSGE